jgi:threonine synthase
VFSYLSHLVCPKCGATYDAGTVHTLCLCGAPLLAAYDLPALRRDLPGPAAFSGRAASLWRYHELLPVQSDAGVVSLGEGTTALLPLPRMGAAIGIPGLLLKDEGLLPTGSFKARGAAVGVARARELGVRELAMPTNGNAGSAWAAYAARAGLAMHIVLPSSAPALPRNECLMTGADLYLVDGLISDAGRIVARAVAERGWFDASTLKEPYRIEGKKTMGLEIFEALGWQVPDVILYPTGGGVGLIGIHKALRELQELGFVGERSPRFVAVQATGCAPIVQAYAERREESSFWPDSETVAFGINVPKALGDFLVLRALYETDGCAVAVGDEAILREQELCGRLEGTYICPEGAATLAAARQLAAEGWIAPGETVVAINTGGGVKYVEAVRKEPQGLLSKDGAIPA